MAYKDTIHIMGRQEPAVNIRYVIGPSADNGPADIKLVQTLFRYLSHLGKTPTKRYTGLRLSELPAVNGRLDEKTKKAIWSFQMTNSRFLQNIDGYIHPASYQNRKLSGRPKFMTITLMHLLAQEVTLHNPEPSYIDGLIKITPELGAWLA